MHTPSSLAIETLSSLQQQAIQDFDLPHLSAGTVWGRINPELFDEAYSELPRPARQRWLEKLGGDLDRLREVSGLTPDQDLLSQKLMEQALSELKRRNETISNIEIPERIVLGSLPIGQMNAFTIELKDSNEYLILFQNGLFGTLNLLARLLADIWPEPPSGEAATLLAERDLLISEVNSKTYLSSRLVEILRFSLIEGNPHLCRVNPLSDAKMGMKESILLNAELFVIGHEFGHIVRKHFSPSRAAPATQGNLALSVTSRSHQEEFGADLSGFEYVTAFGTQTPADLCLSYYGCCFFLSCSDIIERALSLLPGANDGKRARDTHPTGEQRRLALSNILRSQIGSANAGLLIEAYDGIQSACERMWRNAEPLWLKLASEGHVAAKIWSAAVECQDRPASFEEDPRDTTIRRLGFESLDKIEDYKGQAFLALLTCFDMTESDRTKAAAWILEHPHMPVVCLVHELALAPAQRKEGFFEYLLNRCEGLSTWVTRLRYVVERHSNNADIFGVPEVGIEVVVGMKYLRTLAASVLDGSPLEYVRTYMDVAFKVTQGISTDIKN